MTCELDSREQRLDDFLLHKLSEHEAEAFEIHVFGCAECLAELRLREQMMMLMQEERATETQTTSAKSSAVLVWAIVDFFRSRPNVWIYAGAAAALLVAILVSPIFRGKESAENYAANFTASPRLESLVGQTLRSSDLSVSDASPRNGENFSSGDISFRWQGKKNDEDFEISLALKVLNNQETPIHSVQVDEQEYRLREHLAPGLYYWTLEYQGEILYLGKFRIIRAK